MGGSAVRWEIVDGEVSLMGIRQVRIGCDFVYDAEVDTPTVFQVTPRGVDGVHIDGERWSFAPPQDGVEARSEFEYSESCRM